MTGFSRRPRSREVLQGIINHYSNAADNPETNYSKNSPVVQKLITRLKREMNGEVESYEQKAERQKALTDLYRGNTPIYNERNLAAETTRAAEAKRIRLATSAIGELPIEEALPSIYDLISSEKSKYSQLPRANYSGKQIASKSPLTSRAEEFTQGYANKGVPNQNKINSLLARNSRGLSSENLAEIRDFLADQQQNYIENNSLNVLKNRFRDPFNNQTIDKFRRKGQKDIHNEQAVFGEKLRAFGNQLGLYEDMSNLEKARLLMEHGKGKTKLRDREVEILNNYGNQQQAHENMQIEANKNNFNREANKPHQNIELLEAAIEPYRLEAERNLKKRIVKEKHELARAATIQDNHADSYGEYVDTDIDRSSLPSSGFYDALSRYGIDIHAKKNQWTNNTPAINSNTQPIAKQNVANIPTDLKESHDEMLRFNPKLIETNRDQRKNLTNAILNESNIGDEITSQAPAHIVEKIAQMEREGKKTLKKELATLTNKYVQRNQYNSSAHQGAAAQKARELNRQIMNLRNQILEEELSTLTHNRKNADKNRMARISLLNQQREDQLNHALNSNVIKNARGYNQFTNAQNELDDRFKTDYENEMYDWPHLRPAIANGQLPIPAFLNRNNSSYGGN